MHSFPYIDIHTHQSRAENSIVTVRNLYPGEDIPSFNGRNFFSVGLHPWKIKSPRENNDQLEMMEDALELDHVIFLGECGLDKLADTNFEEQMRVFEAQVFMAEEYNIPLIIHCVKAYNEIIEVHKRNHPSVPWIFHGYNANLQVSKQLMERNMLFSFGTILFKSNAKAIDSFKFLPSEKIFFETDNSEKNIETVYRKGAFVKGIKTEELKEQVWENFNRIENISFNQSE